MKSVLTRRSFIAGASGFAAALTSCGVFAAVALAAPGQPPQKPGEGGGPGGGLGGGPGGGDAGANTEPNATVILQDGDALSGGTYTATEVDQSVFEASGNVTATLDGVSIQKTAGNASSADGSSFYGVNAAVRVYGDAHVTLKNCKVTAQAENATGVFAYQNGVIEIADSTVEVTGGGAGGVQVSGGGTLYGSNLTVTSASKAAIRSDRGGGILDLTGGTYTSTGTNGCPVIYSTADITVRDATCISEQSRAVIIEGKNSVTVENCELIANDQSTKEDSLRANVMLYQSMSGDASEGTSVFTMKKGSMRSESGAMFYCTNTACIVNLEEAELTLSDDKSLLIISTGRWGKEGSNGGECAFIATKQALEGSITVDEISALSLRLTGSTYTGAINEGGHAGYVEVKLDESSTWTLLGDSYISDFSGDLANVKPNGFMLYINGEPAL
ncbi:MAG: hypothetical protein IKE43_05595 [Coriobacteriales bacterium]|nr:hypothetical protein [Coriobacteriales bacterium]